MIRTTRLLRRAEMAWHRGAQVARTTKPKSIEKIILDAFFMPYTPFFVRAGIYKFVLGCPPFDHFIKKIRLMKNIGIFFALALFLMSWTSLNPFTTMNGINEKAYQKSLEAFEAGKTAHQNSYQFTLSFSSWSGYWQKTTMIVQEGKVVERQFESGHEYEKKYNKTWKETGAKLGSHEDGHAPMTMDAVYEEAQGWIKGSAENDYFFSTDATGIVTTAGFVPKECMDDCFEGYHVEGFAWLK